jgi:hypothetical protein
MEQSKAMEYESRKASSDVLKPCNFIFFMKKTIVVLWFKVPVLEGVGETMNSLSTG